LGAHLLRHDTNAWLMGLATVAEELARGCGSTAMIWAMHQVQVACVEQHCGESPALRELLCNATTMGWLVASVTSERGTGGDLRSSIAAVEAAADRDGAYAIDKSAPTISYGAQAQAFLVTLRRSTDGPRSEQVAVLLKRDQVTLTALDIWDPLGMRGTCSPGYRVEAVFDAGQILPVPFAEIAARTMVPLSHLLWAAVWVGLAAEALTRATQWVRQRVHHSPELPADRQLAEAHWRLTGVRAQVTEFARLCAPVVDASRPATAGFAAAANALKLAASETCLLVTQLAMRSCGMAGYSERGEFSVARLLRDLHSAPLMIGNERLLATNAGLALMLKGNG
jgi:acyl-CoA dehydrogenase